MNPVAFQFGNFTVHWYGVLVACGFLAGIWLTAWRARREGKGWRILHPEALKTRPIAFFGLRACDLAAIAVQDRTLLGGAYIDTVYRDLRQGALFIVANCARPASTCFCASMGSGPSAVVSASNSAAPGPFTQRPCTAVGASPGISQKASKPRK